MIREFGMRPVTVVRLGGLLTVAVTLLLVTGCGGGEPSQVPLSGQVVKGKVVLASGKPLSKGKVVLWPQQEPMMQIMGKIESDGTFTLKAAGVAVGVSHGDFLVTVEPEGYISGLTAKPKGLQYPAKYLNDQTSGLKVTITPETTELPTIELK